MDKEEKNGSNEEGEEMPAAAVKQSNSFSDFLVANKEKVLKVANSNTKRNENGQVVIAEGDSWKNETEWDTIYEELKQK